MWWVGGRFESACNGIRVFFCFLFLLKIPFKSPCRAFWCGVRSNGKGRQLITLNKSFLSYQLWNTLSQCLPQGAEDTSVFVILFFVCFFLRQNGFTRGTYSCKAARPSLAVQCCTSGIRATSTRLQLSSNHATRPTPHHRPTSCFLFTSSFSLMKFNSCT